MSASAGRVSVIMPLHDKAAYVVAALESALRQVPAPGEILVIDDGSTDGGGDLVARWIAQQPAEAGVRLLRQANAGVAAARNLGLAQARGEFVAFLDADDQYEPGYLAAIEALVAAFPQAGMYCAGYWRCGPGPERQARRLPDVARGAMLRIDSFHARWSRGAFTHTNSIVLRRAVLVAHALGFPVGERHGEDQDLWLRVAEVAPVAFVNEALTAYRLDVPGSAMQSAGLDRPLPAYLRLEQRLAAGEIPPDLHNGARQLIAVHRINVAVARLNRKNCRGAAELLFLPGTSVRRLYWLRTVLRWLGMRLRGVLAPPEN
ncbi:MAG: hypothetical protein RLZZ592_99 [Pseudomonadota bacterium]|jgi:hypothetical protein|nr:hypothetical protein [Pseudomonadota bacterium]